MSNDNLCPSCGISRDVLVSMLKECHPTDNFEQALKIVANCSTCKTALGGFVDSCKAIVDGRIYEG